VGIPTKSTPLTSCALVIEDLLKLIGGCRADRIDGQQTPAEIALRRCQAVRDDPGRRLGNEQT
jgi:hypothetical protein